MAATTKIWSNGLAPTCEDVDLNGFKDENNNLIVGSGQALNTGDNQQTHKAVAHYAATGDFYVDSGAADAYVLSVTGVQVAPPTYATGMRIRFEAGNSNTGASTVNVAGLGVKAIKDSAGDALTANSLQAGFNYEAEYDGVDFILYWSVGVFKIVVVIFTLRHLLVHHSALFIGDILHQWRIFVVHFLRES